MSNAVMHLAEEVEKELNRQFADVYTDPFKLPTAHLYGVNLDATGNVIDVVFVDSHPDIYDLISIPASKIGYKFKHYALVTSGWAAPLSEDGTVDTAPSQHADRRRVRLTVTLTLDGVASVMRFSDDPDNTITDPGQATGALADAVVRFIAG